MFVTCFSTIDSILLNMFEIIIRFDFPTIIGVLYTSVYTIYTQVHINIHASEKIKTIYNLRLRE
jgi:hypothetical protein